MKEGALLFPRSWGAEFIRPGEVLFRTWAPSHDEIGLELNGAVTPMGSVGDGWHELLVDGVENGAPYRFRLPDGMLVPDPATRAQHGDVHSPSLVIDPTAFEWRNVSWKGRPWEEAVIYEMHVGAFTAQGTFETAQERLGHLAELGVTAVELMPVAQFSGNRGWGYDGVLPYAPHRAYGGPDSLKAFVDAAHGHGLMVLLDVVYNHFGPDGAYIHALCPDFFDESRHTPWGPAIDFGRREVRDFFIDNALYWLSEYGLDGLRLDAVDQTDDDFLRELAERVRAANFKRPIHLSTEDNRNVAGLHQRDVDGRAALYTAEWNDDFHNGAHAVLTGEHEAYYEDFSGDAGWTLLARSLAEGYAFQGEFSRHAGAERGEPCRDLPPTAFIDFLQNHDQVGNRALGERLPALCDPELLALMQAVLLLSPHIPMLFMGEEWGEERPFLFFTDFQGDLARAVREGRRTEFSHFAGFTGQADAVPDPNETSTFERSRLDWSGCSAPGGRAQLDRIRRLLATRREHVVPHLARARGDCGRVLHASPGRIAVDWRLDGARLYLRAAFGAQGAPLPDAQGETIWSEGEEEAGRFVRWTSSRN